MTRRDISFPPNQPAREGVVIGGPASPTPEERFTTSAKAANAQEPTHLDLKSEEWRWSSWVPNSVATLVVKTVVRDYLCSVILFYMAFFL